MPDVPEDRSYRALLAVPGLWRILLGSTIARTAQSMVAIALVLFTLGHFGSPLLAGAVSFASIFPGLLLSPVAGALLDRHGRTRLVILDYFVSAVAMVVIAALALGNALPAWLLLLIAGISSVTGIFSHTGLRSLFPLLVPERLWERVNAVDSNGYVVATILGPPAAGALVQVLGGAYGLAAIAVVFGLAGVTLLGIPDPRPGTVTTGSILADAVEGVRYAWNNRVIRALGFSVSTLNLANGVLIVLVPLIVLERLGGSPAVVGLVFAVQGVTGMAAAFVVGRWRTEGRERAMIVRPTVLVAAATSLLLVPIGLPAVVIAFALLGVLYGPLDVAMFTLRQRRTDPAWMGRAFAISMGVNYIGFPVGSFVGGILAEVSIEAAIGFAIGAAVVAAFFAATMLPHDAPATTAAPRVAGAEGTET